MWGLELVAEDGSPESVKTDQILENLKEQGILVGKTGPGRNVLTLMPPLIINEAQIDELLLGLDRTLESVSIC